MKVGWTVDPKDKNGFIYVKFKAVFMNIYFFSKEARILKKKKHLKTGAETNLRVKNGLPRLSISFF